MLHAPLIITTAKLDISLLLKSSPSPPPRSPPPAQDPPPRSSSVPVPSTVHYRPSLSSHRTSTSSNLSISNLSTAASQPGTISTPPQIYAQPSHNLLPPHSNPPSSYGSSQPSPRIPQQQVPPPPPPPPPAQAQLSAKRPPPTQPHPLASPAKKQSKWTPEEDAQIIELRGSGMKWEDISKHLPGRSAISCRLHYQNYLERRSEWDEERKNRLARLYERYVFPSLPFPLPPFLPQSSKNAHHPRPKRARKPKH